MKKTTLLKTMLLLCALIVGSSNLWAVDYSTVLTLDCATASKSSSSSELSTSTLDTFLESAASTTNKITVSSASKVYGQKGSGGTGIPTYCLKVGTASGAGSFSFTIDNSYDAIDRVEITGYGWKATSEISVNSGTGQNPTAAATETNFNFDLASASRTISISVTTSAVCITSIVLKAKSTSSVKAPTISRAAGAYDYGTTVTLSQEDSKPIYYTTDGSTPTTSSTPYSSAISITSDFTLKAVAYDSETTSYSSVAEAAYTVTRPDAPSFSEEAGDVESGTEVTVTAPVGCTLYYTTDGSTDPTGVGGTSAGSNTKTFTISANTTLKAASKDTHGFFSSVETKAYTVVAFSDPTFSVADMSIESGDQKTPVVTTNSAGTVTFTTGDASIATIVGSKVNAVAKGTVTITANLTKDATNHYRAATTTFEVTVTPEVVWESTSDGIDVLTYTLLGLNTSSTGTYANFSNKSHKSSAKYAGQGYNKTDLGYIQIRKSSPSGIISTTSGGKVRKIVVDWNSGTTDDGRGIEIYGKNTAYSESSDLYNDATKGTLLGTIIYNSTTELKISDDYQYVGILATKPLYMNSVTIYWEGDAVSLSDASDYSPTAKDYAKATLNRSFVAGWNGIILPFDLTTSVKSALGASAVKTLGDATESAGAVTLEFEDASLPVSAGTPVLVKLDAAKESGDVILNGVQIKTTTPTTVAKTVSGNTFTLTGTYSTVDLEDEEVYLVSNDKFYHKKAKVALTAKPFRAYIVQTASGGAHLMDVNFDLEGGEATAIVEVKGNRVEGRNECFNLAGQRVQNPTKGLYIMNGKKYIVK